MRSATLWLSAAAIAVAANTATAQMPVAGIDYRTLQPQQAAAQRAPIEVTEFFWYRCPHCYALEPLVERWSANLPPQVHFRRVPAVLGREWAIDARVFYALESLGEVERLHRPLLDAIHKEGGRKLAREQYARWVADWLHGRGVEPQAYAAAYDSPQVKEKVRQAAALARAYQLEATPSFVVAERFVVSPAIGDRRRILEITGYLVSRVQADSHARR